MSSNVLSRVTSCQLVTISPEVQILFPTLLEQTKWFKKVELVSDSGARGDLYVPASELRHGTLPAMCAGGTPPTATGARYNQGGRRPTQHSCSIFFTLLFGVNS